MSKQNDATGRRAYSEPRLVEYGALTDLTRASLASAKNAENATINMGVCTQGKNPSTMRYKPC